MNKPRQAGTAALCRLALAAASLSCASAPGQAARIALDVGHNLEKPGAISAFGETEFSYNQALARVIASTLEGAGHDVTLIGDDGMMLELKPRAEAAAGFDLFVSVHHDSMKQEYLEEWLVNGQPRWMSERFQGHSLFVYPDGPQYAQSLHCASALARQLQKRGLTPTLHHADGIAGENRPLLDRELGIYAANFAVLRHNTVPAILFEAGVILHPEEAKTLKLLDTRKKIASALADSLHCLRP
ncbi:N-acetylmuramoyl-L-alanine amidase family protein [Chitinilyticum litopenaei]|uniref:N-acetylmuramoyl-L-alanine amidase family protein n=1 Tax=Chitinilyticum litopenaei TaxID=1121276 RepID=UPI0004152916|nr:N-acetylmuramoyl-L-alanine amidase [Chitinilyticum litopenaei]